MEKFSCSCSESLIASKDLKSHLRNAGVHLIKLNNQSIQNSYSKKSKYNDPKKIKPVRLLHNQEAVFQELNI